MKNIILLCCCILGWSACSKVEKDVTVTSGDYLSFGTAYGMCDGNCVRLYQLRDGKLYPDDMDRFISGSYEEYRFKSKAMDKAAYDKAVVLLNEFPAFLDSYKDTTFGCPDCHDQGGIHIQKRSKGVVSNWHIDMDTVAQPAAIRPYLVKLLQVANELNP